MKGLPPFARAFDHASWQASVSKHWAAWFLFCAWLSVGVRATLMGGSTFAGLLDDLACAALATALFASFGRAPRVVRVVLQLAFVLSMIFAVVSQTIHYRFFGGFINLESIVLASQMGAAATSVGDLLSPRVLLSGALIPLALGILALKASWGFGRRQISRVVLVLCAGTVVLLGVRQLVLGELTGPAYANPLLLVARQLTGTSDAPGEEAELSIEVMAETFHIPGERYAPLERDSHPLYRAPETESSPQAATRPTDPPNVVLILMESVRQYEAQLGMQGQSLTPRLRGLAEQGLVGVNHYAVGHQTVRGEASILCSVFTHLGGAPIHVRFSGVRMRCLPEILQDHGYATYWISSFDQTYFNKYEFLRGHGVQHFHDMSELPRPPPSRWIGWGPIDEDLMDYAIGKLNRSRQPFFAEIMTLSNHHPFNHAYPMEAPAESRNDRHDRLYRDYLRGVAYTDHSVGHFFDAARSEPWFDNTIFVVTGDHGTSAAPFMVNEDAEPTEPIELFYRSPLVIVGPGVDPRSVSFVTSQIDIAPTVLDLVGIRSANSFMGVSMLDELPPEERFAVFASSSEWHIRQGNRHCYAIGTGCLEDGFPRCASGQSERPAGHACFETELDLLRLSDPRVGPSMRPMDASDAESLLRRGGRVVSITQQLLNEDRIYPYDE